MSEGALTQQYLLELPRGSARPSYKKAAIAGLGSEKPADGQAPYDGKDGFFVNYQMNDDLAVLCSEQTTEEVQREKKFAHNCEAQKAKVTVCYCGLKVCSEDLASKDVDTVLWHQKT